MLEVTCSVSKWRWSLGATRCGWMLLAWLLVLPALGQHPWTNFVGQPGGEGNADGTGVDARFSVPSGVAMDVSGNVYVADQMNHTIRKISPTGLVTTLAGRAGNPGSANGTGTAARFNQPVAVAVNRDGLVYVADWGNHLIRQVTPAGVVTTLAGEAGVAGSTDGTGQAARFDAPFAMAVGPDNHVYVADTNNHTLRKITPEGVVTTLAGSAGVSGSDDGTGSAALFAYPGGVAVDADGDVFVADSGNQLIRQITPAGVVTTLAGSAGQIGSTDGTGSAALFNSPRGLVVRSNGDLFVADANNHTLRKITAAGVVTTFAGAAGLDGRVDATGTTARFNTPNGLAVDALGALIVGDGQNHSIRKVTASGVVTTLAGSPSAAGLVDGTGAVARFMEPTSVALDSVGNLYVADTYNHTIRKVTAAGVVTTLAGNPGVSGSDDGIGAAALFSYPSGVAVDSTGNVYVGDYSNSTIRKVTAAGVVTTLAGLAGASGSTDATGTAARFETPSGLALDSAGNVFVADTNSHTIRKVTPAGVVTTLAGRAGSDGSTDGTGDAALFRSPAYVAVDASGNVFVADTYNHTIRKVTPAGVVTTIAGSPGQSGSADGIGAAARFSHPKGVAVDHRGNVLVADYDFHLLRRITPGGVVTTVAGSPGVAGAASGIGSSARFAYPAGLIVAASGRAYLADSGNHRIATILSVHDRLTATVSPANQQVASGASASFTVSTNASESLTYQWRRNGVNIARATGASYTVPKVLLAQVGSYDVVVKKGSETAIATPGQLSLTPALLVTASPSDVEAGFGEQASFNVSVPGATGFQWLKNGTPIKGATGMSYVLPSVTAVDAGLYSVTVTGPTGKVTTSAAQLRFRDTGLLIYKLTGTGNAYVSTASSSAAVAGFLILDRVGQRGGILWTGKSGTINTWRTELHENMRSHSTGPVPKSQTVITEIEQEGVAPDQDEFVIWLRGTDGLITLSATDKTVAPQTLAGTAQVLEVSGGTRTETVNIQLALNPSDTLSARQKGESVEEALNRIAMRLYAAGYAPEP